MSGGHPELKLQADDAFKFLVCETHIGNSNVDFQCKGYTYTRREDGNYLINLGFTWEKLLLAARAIAAVKEPSDVCVISSRPFAQRALLKFAAHTGATPIVGRFVPGSFTNQIQKHFKEPTLIIVSDPRIDHQAIKEASYGNIPVISFVDTDSPMSFVDIAIPCNNRGIQSIGLMWWMLAREVLRLRNKIVIEKNMFILGDLLVMPDLYFYRDPEDQKKEELGVEQQEQQQPEDAQAEVGDEGAAQPPPLEIPEDGGKIEFHYEAISDWAAASAQPPTANQPEETHQPAAEPAQPTATNWHHVVDNGGWD